MSWGMIILTILGFYLYLIMTKPLIFWLVIVPITIIIVISFIGWLNKYK